MNTDQWKQFQPYFTPDECGREMDANFLALALKARKTMNAPWEILAGFAQDGHATKSMHYTGQALDFWTDLSPRIVIPTLIKSGLTGIGIYYWGSHYAATNKPFYHIDNRQPDRFQMWISPRSGEYNYLIK